MSIDPGPHDLSKVRAILAPGGAATLKRDSPTFYEELGRNFPDFKDHILIQRYSFDEPWGMWEMHPHGDEFVYLLEGDVDFTLKTPGEAPRTVRVSEPGSYVMVPKGAWHTATPHEPTTLLFVTPGEGTRNEAEPEG